MIIEKTARQYYIESIPVDENAAKLYWKKLYKSYDNFYDNVIGGKTHPELQSFADEIEESWNDIPEITVSMAFAEKNIEVRRLYFKAIGVIDLFKELKPVLIDKQTLEKEGISWLENNTEVSKTMKDEYELYEIEGSRLFPEEKSEWRVQNATIYAVRCWCSTTSREYWIYVPSNIGRNKDAIEAIAWTVQLNITEPEYIYRQGDVILAKHSSTSQECRPYHLSKVQYIKLLKSES